MRWTVIPTTIHPPQPFWLSETLFLMVSQLFYVSPNRHMPRIVIPTTVCPLQPSGSLSIFVSVLKRTTTTERHTHNGPSCMTVIMVRDPSPKGLHIFFKCPLTDTYDGPSYLWQSVLHIPSHLSETLLQGSPYKQSLSKTRWTPWRSVILTTSRQLVRRVSLLMQNSHYILALILFFFVFAHPVCSFSY